MLWLQKLVPKIIKKTKQNKKKHHIKIDWNHPRKNGFSWFVSQYIFLNEISQSSDIRIEVTN